jgi:hypothetical protein
MMRGANVVEGDGISRGEGSLRLFALQARAGVALATRFTRVAPGP